MQKLVALTGAGMSAESGIRTFRDSGGLWEEHRVEEVATPEAWEENPGLVLRFYNQRRTQLANATPNAGHFSLAQLEKDYDVVIITQNVDDLHERAGSKRVLHLHGLLTQARSSKDPGIIVDIGYRDIQEGEMASDNSLLRPNIVWFGEMVPAMEQAAAIASTADIFVVIGTSLNVYPAAGLIHYVPQKIPVFLIDPKTVNVFTPHKVEYIREGACNGTVLLAEKLKITGTNS